MSTLARIYFDFLNNFFSYLLLCTMISHTLHIIINKRRNLIPLIVLFIYSIPENIPFGNFIGITISLLITLYLCQPQIKKAFILFIKYKLLLILGQFTIQFVHTLLTFDFNTTLSSPYYAYCKMTICTAMVYICYALYVNGKRMRQLQTRYQHLFTVIILSISLALSYLTLSICQMPEIEGPVIPVLFSILFILIAVCIHIYQRFIDLLEENLHNQIMLEQNKLSDDYSKQIEHNLKELHSLRHDIRNHLLTIDGYASHENYNSIHEYIAKITTNYTDIPIFDTPSDVISALLNAKHQLARNLNINFSVDWNFPYVHIEDFPVITILGNLIDNAITAAGKCEKGWISLSMIQTDSYLEIHIKNNHIETIQEKNGIFQSTKPKDQFLHGLGIKNIRSTVKQLNGHIDITYTDDIFDVSILVPNY